MRFILKRILTSLSVIVAFIAIKMGFPIVDTVVTLMIALFIAYAAFGIVQESSKVLCDSVVIHNVKQIEEIVLKINGVKACHKIRSRGRADDIHLDLHVQMKPSHQLSETHQVSHDIEEAIKKEIPEVTDVMIHMEPKK